MNFETRFDPKEAEPRLYKAWEEGGLFRADSSSARPAFTNVIPPPNVTGSLHMGHALNNTLQDVLTRWKRMDGHEALYLPGTDHAGIATQNVVERELRKESLTRQQLGREKFLERVWSWKEKYGQTILYQLRRLGCSCDWSRARFTMDDGYSRAVRTVFVHLFRKGLIYRGPRVINWCPRCQTALSDLEVRQAEDPSGRLWFIRYPLAEDPKRSVTVATTRPETMLGDTAVMVHPEDSRYADLVGRKARLPILGRDIPIVADPIVDRAFGTGAVKVTPAHDFNDFEVAKRHGLPSIVVMDGAGRMNENAGPFAGVDRFEARRKVLERLREEGLLEKEEEYPTPLGRCDRCETVVEPYLSEQWFVKMKPLAAPAIEAVRSGRIRFVPDRWAKVYLDWMENIQDWCISRQLWWGHRIPVWTCSCGETIAATETPSACPKCRSADLRQDEDVLDTWFSSALWPFATLGWPDTTDDLKKFFPTSALVTDRGIIYLWVARMIMTSLEFLGERPFADVVINATIMDDAGQRMSKSKGTGVDPLDILDAYGADALRFVLVKLSTGMQDIRFGRNLSKQRAEEGRNFVTKLWNACRYSVVTAGAAKTPPEPPSGKELAVEDRWILSRLHRTAAAVTDALKEYAFGRAAELLYAFVWDEFCDWYLELSKRRSGEDAVRRVLMHVLHTTLRLLHPMCPFVTEEIWNRVWPEAGSIMRQPWPVPDASRIDEKVERRMRAVFDVVRGVRAVRAQYGIAPSVRLGAKAAVAGPELVTLTSPDAVAMVMHLGQLAGFEAAEGLERPPGAARWTGLTATVFVEVAGTFDRAKEISRSEKEQARLEGLRDRLRRQLENEAFRRAKPELAEETEVTLRETETKLKEIGEHIRELREMKS